nr:MAG TPA: hypothetical protein [Caudoviricetes sp.]
METRAFLFFLAFFSYYIIERNFLKGDCYVVSSIFY